jgi:hypothetical protein
MLVNVPAQQRTTLQSLISAAAFLCLQATVITFANKSPYRVRALWVDFSGNEVSGLCLGLHALQFVSACMPCKTVTVSECPLA